MVGVARSGRGAAMLAAQTKQRPVCSPGLDGLPFSRWIRRAQYLCCSTDEDRKNLNNIYMDREFKMAISCDGHRLFASQVNYLPGLHGEIILRAGWFLRDAVAVDKENKYPDWQKTVPPMADKCTSFRVPRGISVFANEGEQEMRVLIEEAGPHFMTCHEWNEQMNEHNRQDARLLNLALLAPIEGCSVVAMFNSKALTEGAVVIVPAVSNPSVDPDFLKTLPWFMVVMGMRQTR